MKRLAPFVATCATALLVLTRLTTAPAVHAAEGPALPISLASLEPAPASSAGAPLTSPGATTERRLAAIHAEDPGAGLPIETALESQPDPEAKARLEQRWRRLATEACVAPTSAERGDALARAAHLAPPAEARRLAMGLTRDPDTRVRAVSLAALRTLDPDEHAHEFAEALRDDEALVRRAALTALAGLRDWERIPPSAQDEISRMLRGARSKTELARLVRQFDWVTTPYFTEEVRLARERLGLSRA